MIKMNYCEECYSANSRVTPLLSAERCLRNHMQYICGTCGRCICIEKDPKRSLRRWNFPFKTLEIAKLYLRAAEYCCQSTCGIYELKNDKSRKSYKILHLILICYLIFLKIKNYLVLRCNQCSKIPSSKSTKSL